MSDLIKCSPVCNCMKCKLYNYLMADVYLDTEDLRIGWAMQSQFRVLGKAEITRIAQKVHTSKSSSEALRASELNLPSIDSSTTENVEPVPFSELPDGALFYLAQTYSYGSRQKYQKVLEDGALHNAVLYTDSYHGIRIPDDAMVIRINK